MLDARVSESRAGVPAVSRRDVSDVHVHHQRRQCVHRLLRSVRHWRCSSKARDRSMHGSGLPVWLSTFLADGIGGGVRLVSTFIPIIACLFLFLSFLEDSGYMGRAAFIVDRLMRRLGLPGKSFVPLIVGFGCNVPAVMATRTLDSEHDRVLTTLMAPYMSCGARLTVYALFAVAFFPTQRPEPGVRAVSARHRRCGDVGADRAALSVAARRIDVRDGAARLPHADAARPAHAYLAAPERLRDARRQSHRRCRDRAESRQHRSVPTAASATKTPTNPCCRRSAER